MSKFKCDNGDRMMVVYPSKLLNIQYVEHSTRCRLNSCANLTSRGEMNE